jgi:hypothetical protein
VFKRVKERNISPGSLHDGKERMESSRQSVAREARQSKRLESGGRATTERKAMAGKPAGTSIPVPADREPVDGHGLEWDSQLRII